MVVLFSYFCFKSEQMAYKKLNRIEEAMEAAGFTRIQLADELKISQHIVGRYCTNQTQPRMPRLYLIAEALDCEARELLVSNAEAKESA